MRTFKVNGLRFKRASVLLALLLASLAASAQTDLYRRYADVKHVRVASVSNFALGNNSVVDVTVIEAEDDIGWEWMMQEFYIGSLPAERAADLRVGADVVTFARRSRANPRDAAPVVDEQIDAAGSCYIGVSYLSRAVYVFCADTEEQYDAIVSLLVKKLMRNSR